MTTSTAVGTSTTTVTTTNSSTGTQTTTSTTTTTTATVGDYGAPCTDGSDCASGGCSATVLMCGIRSPIRVLTRVGRRR